MDLFCQSALRRIIFALVLCAASGPAPSACYTLYNNRAEVIKAGGLPPFGIAWPGPDDAARAASRARGEYLVIAPGNDCPTVAQAMPAVQPMPPALPTIPLVGSGGRDQAAVSVASSAPAVAPPVVTASPAGTGWVPSRSARRKSGGGSGGGSGLCGSPSDRAADGSRCGKRAASER